MKIVVYTTPATGHLYPIMDTALELARRGHQVHVTTLSTQLEHVRRAGLDARPVAAAIEARVVDDFAARNPIESVKRSIATFLDRGEIEIDDLRQVIADERPDVLLVDTNAWGAQAAAEASGLPWATWHPYPLVFPSRDVPPFGPGFAPARGWAGRLRDRLVRPVVTRPIEAFLRRVQALRARAGVPQVESVMAHTMRPPMILAMTAEPFEYPRSDWPANVRLIGPGLWSPPDAVAPETSRPVLLVTCSTEYQADDRLARTAIAAFGEDPRFSLVVTTGGVDPAGIPAPAGVVVQRFVPHAPMLARAAAVICHGGMGITQRALAAGVPVCAVPWGRDQLEVGRRVDVARAGVMLPKKRLSVEGLRRSVDAALARRDGASLVQKSFAQAGGARRAADLVEGLR